MSKISNKKLISVASKYATPTYVYSQEIINNQYNSLKSTLKNIKHEICYAIKANSNLTLLTVLKELGSSFDTVSSGEIRRLIDIGVEPNRIIFSGVGKTKEELTYAIHTQIKSINVESFAELKELHKIAKELKLNGKVSYGLRINPNVPIDVHPHLATGMKTSKFGIDEDLIEELSECVRNYSDCLDLKVVTCHIGSGINDINALNKAYSRVLYCADRFNEEGSKVEYVDFGGGFKVSYTGHYEPLNIAEFGKSLESLIDGKPYTVLFEPGKFIIAESGTLLTKILYTKETTEKNFYVTDAGMNDLIRPSLYDAFHHIDVVPADGGEANDKNTKVYNVVGPICESGCFFAKDRDLPIVGQGDYLAIRDAGAYGFTMASNYNTRAFPTEVLITLDGRIELIRSRQEVEDIYKDERIFAKLHQLKTEGKVVIVGVGGGTASGKTTFVRKIQELIPEEYISVVPTDWYYRDNPKLSKEERDRINYDHPNAFEIDKLSQQLKQLKTCQAVEAPQYEYSKHGRKGETLHVEPKQLIVVEGILALHFPELLSLYDATIFIYASDKLRFERRMNRDIKERARTPESVNQQWQETVAPMHDEYCAPSIVNAKHVVTGNDTGLKLIKDILIDVL